MVNARYIKVTTKDRMVYAFKAYSNVPAGDRLTYIELVQLAKESPNCPIKSNADFDIIEQISESEYNKIIGE